MKKSKIFKKEQVMVYFITFIMISSVFAVIFYGNSETSTEVDYKEFTLTREEGQKNSWSAVISNNKVYFDYFPTEVEYINISREIMGRLSNTLEIDVTSFVNDSNKEMIALAGYELQDQLKSKGIYVRYGFTTESTYNVPIITCNDATSAVPVLYLKESNETKVYLKEDCIILESKNDFDFLRLKDRLLYGIYGMI